MNGNHKGAQKPRRILNLWTLDKARKACPFIASVMVSLREHRLEALQQRRQAERLQARPGPLDPLARSAYCTAIRRAEEGEQRFKAAAGELNALDIFCVDAIAGLAVMPAGPEDQITWLLYDHFAEDPLGRSLETLDEAVEKGIRCQIGA